MVTVTEIKKIQGFGHVAQTPVFAAGYRQEQPHGDEAAYLG